MPLAVQEKAKGVIMVTDRELGLMEEELKLRDRINDLLEQRQLLIKTRDDLLIERSDLQSDIEFYKHAAKNKDAFWEGMAGGLIIGFVLGAIIF